MKEFARFDQVKLAGVFDVLPERAAQAAESHPGMPPIPSLEELLHRDDINAVVIATPAESHLEITRTALAAGKHILLEKPMAHTPQDARAIVKLSEARPNLRLLVAHGERFNRPYMDARKAIDDNQLGIPRFISASRISPLHLNSTEWKLGVLDTAVHDIDLILWLMGDAPVAVAAQGTRAKPDSPIADHVSYQIRFAGGMLAQGHIGWVDFQGGYPMLANAHPRMFIAGSHGTLQLDLWQRPVAVNNQRTGAYFWPDDVLVGYAGYFTAITAQNYAFIQSVKTGRSLPISPHEACRAVEVAHAAWQALQQPEPGWIKL